MKFSKWLEEKKKGSKESLPPTAVSSPLRGQNQDQTGHGVKHDVADYTISDQKLFRRLKTVVTEIVSGVSSGTRNTPVNMKTTPHGRAKGSNAPKSVGPQQRAADQRRMQLDTQAQQHSDEQKKRREQLVAQRIKHLQTVQKSLKKV